MYARWLINSKHEQQKGCFNRQKDGQIEKRTKTISKNGALKEQTRSFFFMVFEKETKGIGFVF